ncbi:MAG: hypothetical protein M3401_08350 [Actinomycetota bacterium]|nr:hypothetical protein [Actinomycetota bacterium]
MTTLSRIVFAVLVCATFAAFFAAQELKSKPPRVQHVSVSEVVSPNGDGRYERVFASFDLDRRDDITVKVVERDGDEVRTLVDDRAVGPRERQRVKWDGRDDRGREVPDGIYRIRVNLRRQGRAVTLQQNIDKDTRPPRPRVLDVGPQPGAGPELLPRVDGKPARVRFSAPGTRTEVLVFRTDVRPAQAVFDKPIRLADKAIRWAWDGTVDGRRRVAPGTYVVVVRSRDRAGNIGSSAPIPPRRSARQRLPGRGGITVRYLGVQAPAAPVPAGGRSGVAVDSLDKNYRWRLRRVGSARPRKDGRGTKSRVVGFPTPGGKSGLYLFEMRTATRRATAPLLVQSRQSQRVLVVAPATTWQGVNPVDDDGDGFPNTLRAGGPVQTSRPYVPGGLPPQLRNADALLLAYLDRQGHRYDLTTDVALARGEGPRLAGHRGVILAGDTRWLDAGVGRALRSYVRGGGRVLSVGTNSLRRSVRVANNGRASDPTLPTTRDLFGSRLRPIARAPLTLVSTVDDIGLFAGTEGQFPGIDVFEETQSVAGGAQIVAAAAADDGRRRVIVATRLGKGLVIRPGLPDFALRLRNPGEISRFMESAWTLLSLR